MRRKGRSETKMGMQSPCNFVLGAAFRLAKSLHSAFELITSFGLASATLSVTIDGKGLRVAEYMCLDAILDKSLRRNAYVRDLLVNK